MPCKHIFGSQIQNNTLKNHADQSSPLSTTFFYIVATSKAITSDFSLVTDYSTNPKTTTSCVTPCIYYSCFEGTLASAYCVGPSKASVLIWKLAQFKWFHHKLVKELSGYKENIPFYLHSCFSCYLLPLTHTHATKVTNNLHCDVFQLKRDAIKSNHQHVCRRASKAQLPWDFSLPHQNM